MSGPRVVACVLLSGASILASCALDRLGTMADGDGASLPAPTAAPGAGGTGASGAGSSTGGGSAESCTNGADDDGDGLVDCADDDCAAGFVCAPAPPAGWVGPGRLIEAPFPAPAAPSCPDGALPARYTSEPAGPAECTACACGTLANAVCTPVLHCYSNNDCFGIPADLTNNIASSGCPLVTGLNSCKLTGGVKVTSVGACPPSEATFANTASWVFHDDLCGPPPIAGAGCPSGELCVPRPAAPWDGPACVAQAGVAPACPGGFPHARLLYTGGVDGRGCAPCTCAPNVKCSGAGSVTVHDDIGCGEGGSGTVPMSTTCTGFYGDYLGDWGGSISHTSAVAGGSCAPGGGAPTGAVVPELPLTVCCAD
jgi:hypothetical protein